MNFFDKVSNFSADEGISREFGGDDREAVGSLFNKTDQFAAAFATISGLDYDLFFGFLRFYEYVERLDLEKQMHSAMKDPTSYWKVVESFVRKDAEEIFEVLSGTSNLGKSNGFKAVGVELYNTGTSKIELREEEDWRPDNCSEDLSSILRNPEMIKSSAVLEKKNAIVNAVKALTDVLPMSDAPSNNASARYEKAEEMISSFDEGNFNYDLRGSIKFPKECGVGLPHTMSSQRWLVQALTNLFTAIADCPAGIAVRSDSVTDVSRIEGSSNDPIYFSTDDPSPYNLDYHPSWVVEGVSSEPWQWRSVVDKMVKRINLEYSESSSVERATILNSALRGYLEENYEQLEFREFKFKFMFAKEGIPYFKFFSAGLGSLDDVYQNPDFLHVVSVNIVSQIPDSDYLKVLLPDFNSVVLIPSDFCSCMQLGDFKISSGITITSSDDLSSMRNLVLCYQLSHTFAFIDSLSGGPSYQYREHASKLESTITSRSANKSLFMRGASREEKVAIVKGLSNLFVGGEFGLVIHAERSKIGGRTNRELNKNSAFIKLTKGSRNADRSSGGLGFAQVFMRRDSSSDEDEVDSKNSQQYDETNDSHGGSDLQIPSTVLDSFMENDI